MSSLLIASEKRQKKGLAWEMCCVCVLVRREEEAVSQRRESRVKMLSDRDLKGPADTYI